MIFAEIVGAPDRLSVAGSPVALICLPNASVTDLMGGPFSPLYLYCFTGEPEAFQPAAGRVKLSVCVPDVLTTLTSRVAPLTVGSPAGATMAASFDLRPIFFFGPSFSCSWFPMTPTSAAGTLVAMASAAAAASRPSALPAQGRQGPRLSVARWSSMASPLLRLCVPAGRPTGRGVVRTRAL